MCRRAEGDAAAAGVSGKPETGMAGGMSGKPETSAGPETGFPARTLYGRLKVLEEPGAPLEPEQRLKAMNRPLLAWYETGFTAAFPGVFLFNALSVGISELLVCCILGLPLLAVLTKTGIFSKQVVQ